MSDLTEQLDKVIQQAALDGALTKDAVAQFHSIMTQNDALVADIEKQNKDLGEAHAAHDKLSSRLDTALALNRVAAEAEIAMIDREKTMTTLELTASFQEQRVNDHKEMFTTVFRNSVLRKEVMTPLAPGTMDQGMRGQDGFAQRDTVESEEK